MSSVYRAFLSKMGGTNPAEYVGHEGEIFWDPSVGTLKLSDGSTPGGITINGISNGFQSRNQSPTVTTATLNADASENLDLTAHKGYVLYSITASHPCRVRLYDSDASRTADASRLIDEDAPANAGIIAEAVFGSSGTINFTPGVLGYNAESTPTTTAPVAVTNTGTSPQSIGVSLTFVKIEQG